MDKNGSEKGEDGMASDVRYVEHPQADLTLAGYLSGLLQTSLEHSAKAVIGVNVKPIIAEIIVIVLMILVFIVLLCD